VLALTHLVAGAAVGTLAGRRGPAIGAGFLSHAFLDGIGHDDATVGMAGQAVLGTAGLAALTLAWGPGSPTVAGAVAGAAPDVEVVLWILRGRPEPKRLLFPSHWPRGDRPAEHPYRFPGPGLHIAIEAALTLTACTALTVVGLRRSRSRNGRRRSRSYT
jgi:hypothetical protein